VIRECAGYPDKELVILIALESNPATDYSCEADYNTTVLEFVENSYEPGEFAKQGAVGDCGTRFFRFKALKSSEIEITMSYKCQWEQDILDRRVFTVDIK